MIQGFAGPLDQAGKKSAVDKLKEELDVFFGEKFAKDGFAVGKSLTAAGIEK